jgi:hypothetical protein
MKAENRLKRIFGLLLEAVKKDPNLASEIDRALGHTNGSIEGASTPRAPSSSKRRKPAAFDPFIVYEQGEPALRVRLAELDVEALKDIVAEHGMDPAKLVAKWKTRDRIMDHIVNTVQARSKKGDAFRS